MVLKDAPPGSSLGKSIKLDDLVALRSPVTTDFHDRRDRHYCRYCRYCRYHHCCHYCRYRIWGLLRVSCQVHYS